MKRVHLQTLVEAARSKHSDYLDACLADGKIQGDFLLLEDRAYRALQRRFRTRERVAKWICTRCDHFWAEQEWCMAPECSCISVKPYQPWKMLRCPLPLRKW